jgi:PhnB protein
VSKSIAERRLVMHVELPIVAGHVLMATDMVESMGQQLRVGNNGTVNLEPDTSFETDRRYVALAEGGSETLGMPDMPSGAYWGCCLIVSAFDGCSTVTNRVPRTRRVHGSSRAS